MLQVAGEARKQMVNNIFCDAEQDLRRIGAVVCDDFSVTEAVRPA